MRQSPEFLMYRLMEARAVPDPNRIESVDVGRFRALLATRETSFEQRMGEALAVMQIGRREGASLNDRYARQSARSLAIRSMGHAAEVSRDPHELESIARMILDQRIPVPRQDDTGELANLYHAYRSIILKIAQNPYLSEEAQIRIANTFSKDALISRTLAQNQNITPRTARLIANNAKGQQFVMYALADNISKQARFGTDRAQFAQICKELTTRQVDFPIAPAIHGVTDPQHLRMLYVRHAGRSDIERNLDHATFHAIAQNPDTPMDVIHNMAREPLPDSVGKESALTQSVIFRRIEEERGMRQERALEI